MKVDTGKLVGSIKEDFDVRDIAFSPDGFSIGVSESSAVSECQCRIRLHSLTGDGATKLFTPHNERLESDLRFSRDGKLIVAGADLSSNFWIWKVDDGKEYRALTIPEENEPARDYSFDTSGNRLAVGTGKNIYLWDLANRSLMRTLHGYGPTAFIRDDKYLVGLSNDNLDIWDVAAGKMLVILTIIDDKNWLVTTPDGFFDGTAYAWKQLIWRFNNNTFDYSPVETYFNDFFYPNLLKDVLDGKTPKPKPGQEFERIDRRQPKVEIAAVNDRTRSQINAQAAGQASTSKRMATVAIEVVDNTDKKKQSGHPETSGAQDLRLFRNGSLVKVWHGNVFDKASGCEQMTSAKAGEGRHVRCQAEVQIVAGDDQFTAYAFNSSNVKSSDDSVTIKGAASLKKDGTLYVLAIGVNKYANSAYDLNFAVPDVTEISSALKTQQDKLTQDPKLRQYARTEVITLTDENATKENILLALRRFSEGDKPSISGNSSGPLKQELSRIKPTEPEDALLIYYAGHGTSKGQRFYLLPHNFTGKDERSIDEQGVSDIELNNVLEKVDAGRLLMAIDACQSGQALGAANEGRAPMNSKGLAQLAYDKGMLILTAAQSQQAALEAVNIGGKEIRHGLLTYALLTAFTSPEADKDGNKQLSDREWFDYAASQVPQLQLEAMKQRHADIAKAGRGTEIIYVNGDKNADPSKRAVQTPRVFYRREAETNPFLISKF